MLRVVGVDKGHLERTKLILFNMVTCFVGVAGSTASTASTEFLLGKFNSPDNVLEKDEEEEAKACF